MGAAFCVSAWRVNTAPRVKSNRLLAWGDTKKACLPARFKEEPRKRFELSTCSLRVSCSTAELTRLERKRINLLRMSLCGQSGKSSFVGMTRFELATSTSRTLHATNCATSRLLWIFLSSAFVSACHSEFAVLCKTIADFILDGKDTTFL